VDTLLAEARAHGVRVVLLWFGTWKNGSGHYMPPWMKIDPDRFPRVIDANGRPVDSPSPHGVATLEADVRAFTALMDHLKTADAVHTVILVQVENEAGTWGSVRDYSATAQRLFDSPVPAELLEGLGRPRTPSTWREVFAEDADEFFHAWSVARYVGRVAAAGKAVNPLPMYANAALREPFDPGRPPRYESGGPTDNVIAVWKVAAPALDLVAPDLYMSDARRFRRVLELYDRPDNPLFVPETGLSAAYAPRLFDVLDHGGIGFSPFGVDYTGYSNAPLGAARVDEEELAPFALEYRLIAPMASELAALASAGRLRACAEERERPVQELSLGGWSAVVSYGLGQFGPADHPPGNPVPIGRALVAQTGENEFLVTGFHCRVDFRAPEADAGRQRQFLRVEEGAFSRGAFTPIRLWNGDQTDWGLNFTSAPQVLRVSLATF
jgi:beta-galactosidase GanA